ncbi:MAG: phosphoribosylglycinamide formyltransferase [Spirochaetaceae bacterium]|nr:MAG: phosphoribosylglycinamide formyltransferase [Spirochaetaceae bacterium]
MAKLAVFASGTGSNFAAIADFLMRHTGDTDKHQLVCLVTDRLDAKVVSKSVSRNIPVVAVRYTSRFAAESTLLKELEKYQPDLIALAGFMRLLSPEFVDRYPNRIVNLHPSLLPRHAGLNAIQQSYAAGDSELGITIHYVDHGLDTGPVILQRSFSRNDEDTQADIEGRIHTLEHEHYPRVVQKLLDTIDAQRNGIDAKQTDRED